MNILQKEDVVQKWVKFVLPEELYVDESSRQEFSVKVLTLVSLELLYADRVKLPKNALDRDFVTVADAEIILHFDKQLTTKVLDDLTKAGLLSKTKKGYYLL